MLTKILISITFWGFVCYSAFASEEECASVLMKSITDETQSSLVVNLINNAKSLLDDAKKYATMKSKCPKSAIEKPIDCAVIKERNPLSTSGVYKIWPRTTTNMIEVYCDMDDEGGGWTVIQRRGNFGSEKDFFYKEWESYKYGFGDKKKDFWLGNENIHALSTQRANTVKFTFRDWEGNKTYATFDEFWIDDESRKYTLHVTGFTGTAGDSLSEHNGQPFSTKDQDNDKNNSDNCSVKYKGAWWYKVCHYSNLNGLYFKESSAPNQDGIIWRTFRGTAYSMPDTVIKIRPRTLKGM